MFEIEIKPVGVVYIAAIQQGHPPFLLIKCIGSRLNTRGQTTRLESGGGCTQEVVKRKRRRDEMSTLMGRGPPRYAHQPTF